MPPCAALSIGVPCLSRRPAGRRTEVPVRLPVVRGARPAPHRAQQPRILVAAGTPAPDREQPRQLLAPPRRLRVVQRREATLQHHLEALAPCIEPPPPPRRPLTPLLYPRAPLRLDPLLERVRRAGQRVDASVRPPPLRRRRVVVEDHLHVGVHRLELADERERALDLAFRVIRAAEHERELRDDVVLAG